MHKEVQKKLNQFMEGLIKRNPDQPEFHQSVYDLAEWVMPFIEENKVYEDNLILERMTEPDRLITFRVCWEDDQGNIRANRGYRIQFNNAIGPYKGGLRFHSSVNLSILKFLAFEQVFKNSLTTLPLGGAKGGSNFNPKGKSDREVMRFCQSFMTELAKYIGPNRDVPAGDIGVGAREISFMFGHYMRLQTDFTGVLTGKSLEYGGSLIRPEATGYGVVYFVQEMLKEKGEEITGKISLVSGSGNVAQYAAEKLIELGSKVVTMSDSSGYIYDKDGLDKDKLNFIKHLKEVKRGRIKEYAEKYKCDFYPGKKPWNVPCSLAFPCATQNELNDEDAKILINNGCIAVGEGANMPTETAGVHRFIKNKILFGPAKAANAGGVAVSGLEMSQNSMRISWSRDDVDKRLKDIMNNIHAKCVDYGKEKSYVNYVKGANIAGFKKVADAMVAYGVV